MLKAKSLRFNNYSSSIKQHRLIMNTFFVLFCIVFSNCAGKSDLQNFSAQKQSQISESAVNINTANAYELEKLPRIGSETAQKIIEHREKYGAFRRTEELILVRGMSDKKFREIKNLVKVE